MHDDIMMMVMSRHATTPRVVVSIVIADGCWWPQQQQQWAQIAYPCIIPHAATTAAATAVGARACVASITAGLCGEALLLLLLLPLPSVCACAALCSVAARRACRRG